VRYSVPPPSGDMAGLVSAMSTAVGQLADTVADMIVSSQGNQPRARSRQSG
jgi:hypothetical protein